MSNHPPVQPLSADWSLDLTTDKRGALAAALIPALEDLIRHTLHDMRRTKGGAALPASPWARDAVFDDDQLGMKSIEVMELARVIADHFDLYASGLEDYLLRNRTLAGWANLIAQECLTPDSLIGFATSGSTGEVKICRHRLGDLWAEVSAFAPLFIGPHESRTRIRLMVPAHHIYGFLWGPLLACETGLPLLDRHSAPTYFAPGDLIVSHPDHWGFISQRPQPLAADVWGISSTAPLPVEVAERLRAEAKIGRLFEIYGSSEAGGLGWRDDHRQGYQPMPHIRALKTDDQPDFRRITSPAETLEIADHLEFDTASTQNRFRPAGRRDRLVQISGQNVSLQAVQTALEACDRVAAARVRFDESARQLFALIIPRNTADLSDTSTAEALIRAVDDHAQSALRSWERPLGYHLASSVPTNAMGKEIDWRKNQPID